MLAPALHAGELPAEALAVQATLLDGGVALGVAMHHAVADGRSVWSFLRAWAAECRGEAPDEPPPTFDRAALRLPGGVDLARTVLRKYAPNLPLVTDMPNYLVRARGPGLELSRRTLAVSGRDIRRLKQRIEDMDKQQLRLAQPISSLVALTELAWTSHIRCKRGEVNPKDDVYLFFFTDVRGQLDPPVEESYFGACIVGCVATAAARDILAEDGVSTAAAAAQTEVMRAAEDPLARWDWMETAAALPLERTLSVSGSVRFPAYEATDFGWGPPARTELATMRRDGQVVLVGGRGGDGGVQASVAMHAARIDAFESHFRSWLHE
ncbi:hypothetical protein E2562_000407 [Oryza meyeriana var. granulata]|uniref:Anthocyanin 5-aromatic acyltransferase n=1 Tax=Oryza meyeriana var. granulata TaxID=110450 RepID=A0A6G1CBW4_9ORYZ|nr:hypothetical protein E2562_000407 [Oryza meyeriana var. granulata]